MFYNIGRAKTGVRNVHHGGENMFKHLDRVNVAVPRQKRAGTETTKWLCFLPLAGLLYFIVTFLKLFQQHEFYSKSEAAALCPTSAEHIHIRTFNCVFVICYDFCVYFPYSEMNKLKSFPYIWQNSPSSTLPFSSSSQTILNTNTGFSNQKDQIPCPHRRLHTR